MATSSMQNISRHIKEGIVEAFGPARRLQLLKIFSLEVKPKKFDGRAVVLTEYSMHLFTAKPPVKLEQSVNFIDIKNIESAEPNKARFVLESRKFVLASQDGQSPDIDDLINCISETLVTVFPAIYGPWLSRISLLPVTRMTELSERLEEVRGRDSISSCGSFTYAYHCMCDYHNVPFSEEVAWDIDTIYLYHASTELSLSDFDHLDAKTVVPIISALEHNAWFTKLNLSNFKMTQEVVNELCKVMKTNGCIRELLLCNTGIKLDLLQKLMGAMAANTKLALTSLNTSGNIIEEKGLQCILPVISKVAANMTSLNLSRSSIAGKGMRRLGEILLQNAGFLKSLQCIDLSENSVKGEDLSHFYKYLAQPNAITTLSLAGTECALEHLFSALSIGCVNKLTSLDVSRCVYSYKKLSRDVVVPMHWKDFFTKAVALQSVNFAGCRLPSEAVNFVLVGLSLNTSIKDLELNLSTSALGAGGSQVLECLIANIRCVGSLDISDNGFDQYLIGMLAQLSKNKSIKRLAIGKNLNKIQPRAIPQVMEAVLQLVQNERSSIQSLMLDDLKLKNDLYGLLGALGSNTTLTELDISGNMAGDVGARMLSKALLMNKKLSTIYWDRNVTSAQGFSDIAAALERNFTLKRMPVPFNDVTASMRVNAEKTETALKKIETLLQRNHLPHRMAAEQTYRLQYGLMTSSSQQVIDNATIHLQNIISKLQTSGTQLPDEVQEKIAYAQSLIRDVTAARQLLLEFQGLAEECEGDNAVLSQRLKSMETELQSLVEKQLQTSTGSMLQRAKKQCSAVYTDKLTDELRAGVTSLNSPHEQVRDVVSQQLGYNMLNCVSDINLSVASFIYNRLVEEFMIALDSTLVSLKHAVAALHPGRRQSVVLMMVDAGKQLGAIGRQSSAPAATDNDKRTEEMRKTLLSRRLRPQTTIDQDPAGTDGADPSQSRRMEADMTRKDPQQSVAHMTGTTRSIYAPSFDSDALMPDSDLPKLIHPGKERPRLPRKAALGKRPVIACETLLVEEPAEDDVALSQSSSLPADKMPPLQENVAAPQTSLPASRAEMSLPLTNIASAAVKSADSELLMASVPPTEGTSTPKSEQPTPTDSVPPTFLPRAKLAEEISGDTRQAPVATVPRSSDSLESKLAPAPVSTSELIQPVKKGYIYKQNQLANIMRSSFEKTESKDVRKSAELDVKDASDTSKVQPVVPRSGEVAAGDRASKRDAFITPQQTNGPTSQTANPGNVVKPTPAVRPRKSASKQDSSGFPPSADIPATAAASSPTSPSSPQGATESKDAVKPDVVMRSPAGDSSVQTDAGVAKRSSVRDMAAMFRRT